MTSPRRSAAAVRPYAELCAQIAQAARPLYDRLVAMVKAEIIAPTPRELVFTPSGEVSYGW